MHPDPEIIVEVAEGVYQPSDDTFLLLSVLEVKEDVRVLEIGTGTGIIALHCAKAGARVTATDISRLAVDNAKRNAMLNDLELDVVQTDMSRGLGGKFDVIIFNPPYLCAVGSGALEEAEKLQLIGGEVGSELSIRFLKEVGELMAEQGRIYLLLSSENKEGVLQYAKRGYEPAQAGQKSLFFEKLEVYELTKAR